MKKTFLPLLIVLVLMISLLPSSAMAAGNTWSLKINGNKYEVYKGADPDNGELKGSYNDLASVFADSYAKANKANPLINEGDTIILPAGTVTMPGRVSVYGSVTIEGHPDGTTISFPDSSNWRYTLFFWHRYETDVKNGTIYEQKIKNLTFDGNNKASSAISLSGYNMDLTLENVTIKNFTDTAISTQSGEELTDDSENVLTGSFPSKKDNAVISITLKNVKTENNDSAIKFESLPFGNHPVERFNNPNNFSTVKLNYDENCSFNDNGQYKFGKNGLTYDFSSNVLDKPMNNHIINEYYVFQDTITPIATPVPAAGSSDLPKTGDNSMLMLWLALALISVTTVMAMHRKAFNR